MRFALLMCKDGVMLGIHSDRCLLVFDPMEKEHKVGIQIREEEDYTTVPILGTRLEAAQEISAAMYETEDEIRTNTRTRYRMLKTQFPQCFGVDMSKGIEQSVKE